MLTKKDYEKLFETKKGITTEENERLAELDKQGKLPENYRYSEYDGYYKVEKSELSENEYVNYHIIRMSNDIHFFKTFFIVVLILYIIVTIFQLIFSIATPETTHSLYGILSGIKVM